MEEKVVEQTRSYGGMESSGTKKEKVRLPKLKVPMLMERGGSGRGGERICGR